MTLISSVQEMSTRRQVLWTLVVRDLRVRYSRSFLGYVWTVLDPLCMSSIYFIVFVYLFHRSAVGYKPYFLFLVTGLLAWQWFSGSLNDTSRALLQEAKLVRSTNLPREIWVVRVVIAKGIEYLLSLPVIAAFTLYYMWQGQTTLNARLLLFPVGVVMEFALLIGLGLLLAPVTVLVTDMQRIIRIVLRMLFYLTPILYAKHVIPHPWDRVMWLNPMNGVLELLRAGFFKEPVNWHAVEVGLLVIVVLLLLGQWIFARLERAVLKEI
jgi:ABC-2 type transport system permease protein